MLIKDINNIESYIKSNDFDLDVSKEAIKTLKDKFDIDENILDKLFFDKFKKEIGKLYGKELLSFFKLYIKSLKYIYYNSDKVQFYWNYNKIIGILSRVNELNKSYDYIYYEKLKILFLKDLKSIFYEYVKYNNDPSRIGINIDYINNKVYSTGEDFYTYWQDFYNKISNP